ncbi:MAG: DUF4153 domain-containing protein [Clostridiales bacterium]|nr:DUF4153 domain-containing protein [Clostridiales bacterium]
MFMNKLKTFISRISDSLKESLKKEPVTFTTIILVTLILAVFITTDIKIISNVLIFGIAFSVSCFFVETLFNKKLFKILGYIVSGIISLVFSLIIFNDNIGNVLQENAIRIFVGFVSIMIIMASYVILKKEKLNFSEYILKVLANIFNATIVYVVLSVGITLLSFVFVELILNNGFWDVFLTTQILLLGLFYIPAIVISISNLKKKEVNIFIKGLVKFALLPLISIGILIIYIYIIKILVLGEMPSNVIFRILAIMFMFAFPTWTIAENYKNEGKVISTITKLLPYLYMPFIILEIISLGMRINGFGITPIRCLGIGVIILQIVALILSVVKNKKYLSQILIYLAAAIFILFITPLNYNNISYFSQRVILTKYIKEDTNIKELEIEYKQKAISSYKYLKYNNGEKYIPEYIEKGNLADELKEYYGYSAVSHVEHIYFYENTDYINVKEYSTIIKVNQRNSSNNTMVQFDDYNGNFIIKTDIKDAVTDIIEVNNSKEQDVKEYITENRIIKLDDNKDLYLTSFNLQYYKTNNEIILVSLGGYILQK